MKKPKSGTAADLFALDRKIDDLKAVARAAKREKAVPQGVSMKRAVGDDSYSAADIEVRGFCYFKLVE